MTPGERIGMNADEFTAILFKALADTDKQLSGLAREVKAAIEREDLETACAGIEQMSRRMRELRLASALQTGRLKRGAATCNLLAIRFGNDRMTPRQLAALDCWHRLYGYPADRGGM